MGKSQRVQIPRSAGLTPRERAIEDRVCARVEANPEFFFRLYEARFENELCADNAAELFSEYAESSDTRTWNREAVHAAARWIIFELYRRKVESAKHDGLLWVIFTAGGTGSGKSSRAAEWRGQPGALIYDSTFANLDGARKQINVALSAGVGVLIYYTHRDPAAAFLGVLQRAMGSGRGRTVRLATHAESHRMSALVVQALSAEYQDQPKVRFRFAQNNVLQDTFAEEWLGRFTGERYNEMKAELLEILDEQFSKDAISPEVYRRTQGADS